MIKKTGNAKIMQTEKDFENKHRAEIAAAFVLIGRNFSNLALKISQLIASQPSDVVFNNMLVKILKSFNINIEFIISQSMAKNWNLANQKNDLLVQEYLKNIKVADKAEYFATNIPAMNEFINRTEAGMSLSSRVWNITDTFNTQLSEYLRTGITTGRSAATISVDIRQLLQEPDKLFRRVRSASGGLKLSKPARAYHPGTGVYRSSYKNALRLTATEINMACRMSDHTRRQQLDFIMGFRVHLSKSHPERDLCDYMAGDYPKDFVFRSWHPHCLCFTTSIMMSGSEYRKQEQTGQPPRRMVKEIPGKAKVYLKENADAFNRLKSTPYFIQDNAGTLAPFMKIM